jgi:hypothetical protein
MSVWYAGYAAVFLAGMGCGFLVNDAYRGKGDDL